MTQRVVIIGGGISGLTAAWWLYKGGADVTVLERNTFVGGTMQTLHEDGWLIETGPNSALETTPLFTEMFEGLGILDQRLYADERSNKRYILRNGTLHVLPMSPQAFLASSLWTLTGKLRLLKEPFVGRAEKEETIAEFVERRLGREFLDYAINPFVAGVYAGNPEQSVGWLWWLDIFLRAKVAMVRKKVPPGTQARELMGHILFPATLPLE